MGMARSGLLVDIAPLRRYPRFRRLWLGYLVSTLGNQITVVGVAFEVFRLTGSSLDVGLVSLTQLGPLLVGSMFGGSIADAMDRRKLLLVTQTLLALCSAGLAVDATRHHPLVWPLFAISALAAAISSIDQPARSAVFITLVDRDDFVSATALWQLLMQIGVVVGPAVAGLLIGHVGVATVFWVDVGTFAFSLGTVATMGRMAPEGGGTRFGLRSMTEGLRYLKGRQALQGTFVADLDAMVFGMPRALFPAIGLIRLHGGPATVGLLYAAPGAGALIGAILTGWVSRVSRQGLAVLVAVAIWGAAITAFGFAPWLAAALPLLAVAGAADVISAVFRGTMLQRLAPDALRGRLNAVHTAVVTGGPRLGDAEAGAVAALGGVQVSVVSGGLACLVGIGLVGWLMPRFTSYRDDPLAEVNGPEGPQVPALSHVPEELEPAPGPEP
jgi:predicted MFS family arabinose efflux permease